MAKFKKDEKSSVTIAILPAIIAALAGIIGAFLSYKAGTATIQIPINATQTAEARQLLGTAMPTSSSTINTQGVVPIAIDAIETVQPTGVFVTKGDIVNINVVGGKWTVDREAFPDDVRSELSPEAKDKVAPETWMDWWAETDGTGSDYLCRTIDNCPILNYRLGALIAQIGKVHYTIGNKCSFVATDTDQVFLQINESENELSDNFGILAVEITKGRNDLNTISTNCGVPYP